jgi:CRP-like cAMP-binding protein
MHILQHQNNNNITTKTEIIEYLNQISPFDKEVESMLLEFLKPKFFKKKSTIFEVNTIPEFVYILTKGSVREFIIDKDHNEINIWFGFENDLVVPLSGFVGQKISNCGIQAIEDCEGFLISKKDLYFLYDSSKEIERLGRLIAEKYLIETETYHQDFHYLSAYERYQKLTVSKPWIFNRVSLNQIASYLGISNETLSRFRAKKD